jgi:glycosyltransferase involved in cell wall biosynthesis
MKATVSFPGIQVDAQQAALAYHEEQALNEFVTTIRLAKGNLFEQLTVALPEKSGNYVRRELSRRYISTIPLDAVASQGTWLELLRTASARFSKNPILADAVWDQLSHRFDKGVARRHLSGIGIVHAFEYTARYTFERACELGIAKVLAMPSTSSRQFEKLKLREMERYSDLKSKHDAYFAKRFDMRQKRRDAEIALADVIVANSEVTRQSHIADGAAPEKIVAIPLAAPPPISSVIKSRSDIYRPLSIIWAGNVSIGKGAHYFVDAWRSINAGDHAKVELYGKLGLPERVLRPAPLNFQVMGSVSQVDLFAAFETADVLVFPTLADGFGMVVTEAFSRGLPVITTDRAGASSLIEHGKNGIIVPAADSKALADAMRWCLDNRKALYEMRFRALETAQRWQWADYRRALVAKISEGLDRAGYSLGFGPIRKTAETSILKCASAS